MNPSGDAHAKRVFFVIGEESGDRLGGALAAELKARHGQQVAFEGLAGEALRAQGTHSLFDIEEIAVMGLLPVIMRLPTILKRMRETVDAIIASKPDLVVLIDSPDFTHRVAKAVRKRDPDIPIVGWVSPSVWAWRPGRAAAMRGYMQHLLVLLPFEVQAHKELGGPPATYVGHPLIDQLVDLRPKEGERVELQTCNHPEVLVLPGSRSGELKRHMPLLEDTVQQADKLLRNRHSLEPRWTLPAVEKHASMLSTQVRRWPVAVEVVSGAEAGRAAMRRAHAAVAASGTVTLELALAKVPTVVTYRLDPLAHLFRQLIKTWTIVLPNLIWDRPVIREYVGDLARADLMAHALTALVVDTPERRAQVESFEELDERMNGTDGLSASERAAQVVEQFLFPGKTEAD